MTTNTFSFGDIVSMDVVFSDNSESKIRPVLILSKDREDYLLMSLTSSTLNSATQDMLLIPNSSNNLRAETVARINKLHTYHETIIRKKIGSLSVSEKTSLKKCLQSFITNL